MSPDKITNTFSVNPDNSGELLQQVVSLGRFGVFIVERNTNRIIKASAQVTDSLGYAPEELEGKLSILDLVEDYQKERFLSLVEQSIGASDMGSYAIHDLRRNDGSHHMFVVFVNPIIINGIADEMYYHVLLLPEFSRQQLPFISFDSRELFLEKLNNIGFGTFEWIVETNRVYWSDGVYRIYEVDNDVTEMTLEKAYQFSHPDDAQRATDVVTRAMQTGKDYNIDMKILTAKRNVRHISSTGRVIKDASGKIVKMVGCVMDVTRQKTVEQDLNKNVRELNQSNKELEEFAYVASHDLQEPLRKISTFSDRLNEKYRDALTGDGAMYLERIIASAENMRQLIHNLLEFSRVAKNVEPFMPVNLSLVLKEVMGDLELPIEETGTAIKSNNLPVVEASFSQMKQLFTNLINNAIKFRKAGDTSKIDVTGGMATEDELILHHLPANGVYYKVQLTDNGIGFDDIYAARIFQIFQRLHGKSEYPGSGIGLAICKKILDHHHGVIYAENIPDQGARFTFILPEKQN